MLLSFQHRLADREVQQLYRRIQRIQTVIRIACVGGSKIRFGIFMPTVLVATSTFPRWSKDTVPARFVFDLSLQLKRHFHVIVLAPHAPGAAFRETMDGLEIYRFPYFWPHGLQSLCNGGGIMPALRSGMFPKIQAPFLFLMEWYYLIKILKTRSIDLINSHWMIPQGFSVALAKLFFPRIPHLLTIHSTYP